MQIVFYILAGLGSILIPFGVLALIAFPIWLFTRVPTSPQPVSQTNPGVQVPPTPPVPPRATPPAGDQQYLALVAKWGLGALVFLAAAFLLTWWFYPTFQEKAAGFDTEYALFSLKVAIGALAALALCFTLLFQVTAHGGAIFKYKKVSTSMGFAVLLYALAVAFHPEWRPKLVSPEGVGLLMLAMLGFAAFSIIKEVFWKDSKITAVIMIALMVIVLDGGIMEQLGLKNGNLGQQLSGVWTGFWGSPNTRQTSTAVNNTPRCPGVVQQDTLTASAKLLNPGGNCHIELHEVTSGHCVSVYDRWNNLLGNDCAGGRLVLDGKYPTSFAAARGTPVSVTYVLCDRPGLLRVVADGCP